MALTYELLLDLYRGRSTTVEQITDPTQLGALAIETPIGHLLQELDRSDSPRHVVLTGSAGDGKTFAALTASTQSFEMIADASARRVGVDLAPVDDLAAQIERALRGGRLLLAINRGQLERLYERTNAKGGVLGAFVAETRARTVLRDTWDPTKGSIAVADLGTLDRVPAALAIMRKVAEMPAGAHLAAPTREAFRSACAAFRNQRICDWVASVVKIAIAGSGNVTMRQLWSFISFLATGGRGPADERPLSLDDAVGARLFDSGAEGHLFEIARERCDPALKPNAALTRDIIEGELLTRLKASDLARFVAPGVAVSGRTLTRVAIVHSLGDDQPPPQPMDGFADLVRDLMALPPGPQALGLYPKTLLKGIYKALGFWHLTAVLPGWQTLCYDSSRVRMAATVADSLLNPTAFKISVPRPAPEVAPYLQHDWRPPFVWLTAPGQPRLRLMPRVVRALLAQAQVEQEDLFALDTWLRRVGRAGGIAVTREGETAKLRVSRRSARTRCLVIEEGLYGKTLVSVE